MRDGFVVTVLSVIPRNAWARRMGWLARTPVSRWFVHAFIRFYRVDLDEAQVPVGGFASLDAFFTRTLKPGSRPVDPDPSAVVSPVDGNVAYVGRVHDGVIEVAPGRRVAVEAIVGEPCPQDIDVLVLYLSPRDYHRVHAPLASRARAWRYLPGTLWPVFPAAVRGVDQLFARNERLSIALESAGETFYLVMVGAFGVGRIETVLHTPLTNTDAHPSTGQSDHALAAGDGLGVFHLGSTVVLVGRGGSLAWACEPGQPVRMGQRLARRTGG